METFENKQNEKAGFAGAASEKMSGVKQRLGAFGRRIKRVDLRSQIFDHPFMAVGIAAGVGALVGLARPMPKRGPISGAMMALLSTIGFRLAREAAMIRLGNYAKGLINKDHGEQANVPQSGLGHSAY